MSRKGPLPVLTNGINTKMDVEALLAREANRRGLKLSDLKADIEEKSLSLNDLELISNIPAKTISIAGSQRKGISNGDIENGNVKFSVGKAQGNSRNYGDSKKISFKGRNDVEDEENSDSADSTSSSGVMRSSTSSSPKSVCS